MLNKKETLLEFGVFRLDTVQRLLFAEQRQIPLAPKVFDTLLVLVEAGGRVVSKEELLKRIWPDTYVEEGSLARNISVLRKVLGAGADDQEFIQTIPKRGYRFVVPIRLDNTLIVEEHSRLEATVDIEAVPRSGAPFRRLILLSAVALLAASAVAFALWRSASSSIQSIAVLPLQSLSPNADQDYFVDGMTDAVITGLAQIRGLKVISRASVMRYKGTRKSVPEIARELGVDSVLEGSVQRDGNKVRISARLVRAATDSHIWAQSYDRDVSDILRLEGELATEIAREIQVQIEADTSRHFKGAPRINSAAQDEYLLARTLQDKRDEAHLKQAIQHYEAAIGLEPEFALAFAGMANAWVQRGVLGGIDFRSAEAPARQAAIRALELDPNLAEAHEALAHVLLFYDMAWTTSEQEYRRAIRLQPSNVFAHVYYATLLETLQRYPEAIREGQRSLELDPMSVTVTSEYGRVLYRARKYDAAIRQYQRTLELDPQNMNAQARLVDAYIMAGRYQDAWKVPPPNPQQKARLYALTGRPEEARRLLDPDPPPKRRLPSASAYFTLGERDRGFQLMTKAFDDRQYVSLIVCDPQWDIVRDDPRFQALVRRLGLPPR